MYNKMPIAKKTDKTLKRVINRAKRVKTIKFKPDAYCEIFFVRHALTEQNIKGIKYDNHGEDEYYPIVEEGRQHALKTGRVFQRKYGDFDAAYVSPRHRCQQTFDAINQSLNIPRNKVKLTELLYENPKGDMNLKTKDQAKEYEANMREYNKQYNDIQNAMKKEINEFKQEELDKQARIIRNKMLGRKNISSKNYPKFLKQLAKDIKQHGYKRVICVTHHGGVDEMQELACGGWSPHWAYFGPKPAEIFRLGSNVFVGIKFDYKTGKYSTIIPYNNLQLLEKE